MVTSPESIFPVEPTAPSAGKDQNQPDAAPVVVVANGSAEAAYLYFLAPQTFVCIAVTVTVGAAGTDSKVFINFDALNKLLPQSAV